MENNKEIINILWTGGFDSSFRMVQLSKKNVTIQPYYLCDNRLSEQNELSAITQITEDIKKHSETKCTILPLIKYKVEDIAPDNEITESYLRLREKTFIGSQYDWLPRFAKQKQISGLELSLEKAESSKAQKCILEFGSLKPRNEGEISYYIIDKEKSNNDLVKVFGAFHFPVPLFETTKKEMVEEYKLLGFEETMNKTWFCFTPINNEPCGLCNPCMSAINEGMEFRFPRSSLKRYKHRIYYKIKRKILKKI